MAIQPREELLASNDEFRRLAQEQKLEEVRLKKLKLRLKDQMERIEQQYRREHQVA